jgi:4-amino-4-deoxy-L-arabinose transferase-like glycosyltransferase
MERTCHYGDNLEPDAPPTRLKTAADLAVVFVLIAAVVGISAHAPSHLYAYAQLKRVSSAIAMLQTGEWLLPTNQTGGIASKPQLYPWLTAAALKLTGAYGDFVFRLPTVLATVATGAMVYFLGRRWYGRRVGLLAACFWATGLRMQRMAYLASTDMLLTAFVTGSILCADRLLFHPAPPRERWGWAVGLWACMILGALAKGWGLVNLALVALALAFAAALGPGFAELRNAQRMGRKASLAGRLVLGRIRAAMKATYFLWGLLAMAAVLVPLWIAMFLRGGQEFRHLVYHEFFQRATGAGEHAPGAASAPAVLHLIYYCLPGSAFAVAAMPLVPIRRWLSREGPFCLPLCWILGVLVPFSLAHGFRPDYLLPCHAAVAMIGAWGVETVLRSRERPSLAVRIVRHAYAAVAVAACLAVVCVSAWYLYRARTEFLVETKTNPGVVLPPSWNCLYVLPPIGLMGVGVGVVASLRWRLRRVADVAMLGMLGLMLLHTHVLSRHAGTGDGEVMREFGLAARSQIGGQAFAVYRAAKLSVELYLGRLGVQAAVVTPKEQADLRSAGRRLRPLAELHGDRSMVLVARGGQGDPPTPRWLITCDRGLCEIGAWREDPNGPYVLKVVAQTPQGPRDRKLRVQTLPQHFGAVQTTSKPIQSQNWGSIHLIHLEQPVRISGEPLISVWEAGRRDEDED